MTLKQPEAAVQKFGLYFSLMTHAGRCRNSYLQFTNDAMDSEELIAKVADWSQRDDRVIASGVCGSHARGEATPDSDIDFCILTSDPDSLLSDRSWIAEFGPGARIDEAVEDYNLVQSIRVYYGETEAEFGITDQAWIEPPIDHETAGVMNDGLRILYDSSGRLEQAVAIAASFNQ